MHTHNHPCYRSELNAFCANPKTVLVSSYHTYCFISLITQHPGPRNCNLSLSLSLSHTHTHTHTHNIHKPTNGCLGANRNWIEVQSTTSDFCFRGFLRLKTSHQISQFHWRIKGKNEIFFLPLTNPRISV